MATAASYGNDAYKLMMVCAKKYFNRKKKMKVDYIPTLFILGCLCSTSDKNKMYEGTDDEKMDE